MNRMFVYRWPRAILVRILRIINRGLHHLECVLPGASDKPLSHRPIFIVGAPRSGSTLLLQVMVDYFDLGYVTNLHCLFFGAPSLIERWVHPLKWQMPSNYTSNYGGTRGWIAPSECGEFWYRFFRRKPSHVFLEDMDSRSMHKLRVAIAALGEAFGKPSVFKNLYCSLRLLPIAHVLPEALFIIIRRDEVEIGHSILEGRLKLFGDYNHWFSVDPPGTESLKKLPPHQQVIEQVRYIHELIDQHKKIIGEDRFCELKYEALCTDTQAAMREIESFFTKHNVSVNRRWEIPERLPTKLSVRIDPELYDKLVTYARQRPGNHNAS